MMAADHDVIEYAHMVEERQILEGAADAQPCAVGGPAAGDVGAFESHPALGWPVTPGNAVQKRGFSRAVGSDNREKLARPYAKADMGERAHAAEAQRNVADLKDFGHSGACCVSSAPSELVTA